VQHLSYDLPGILLKSAGASIGWFTILGDGGFIQNSPEFVQSAGKLTPNMANPTVKPKVGLVRERFQISGKNETLQR
jgi:hypothetical protein